MTRIDLSLSRISRLLALLPPPTWKAVHIAGTNGKGSVAAYLTTLLRRHVRYNDSTANHSELANGESRRLIAQNDRSRSNSTNFAQKFNVGRFTSPHFIDRWDCITINNQSVSKDVFLEVEAEVRQRADEVEFEFRKLRTAHPDGDVNHNAQDETITPFELLTATAFQIFTKARVHIAVVECGLGGRLDATNAMQDSGVALSIITRIGLDHINLLGNTIEEITKEKSGIFRPGVPIIVDDENEASVKAVIKAECETRSAGQLSFASWHNQSQSSGRHAAHVTEQATEHASVTTGKMTADELMPHQCANWAVAIAAFRALMKQSTEGQLGPHLHFSGLAASDQTLQLIADAFDEAHVSYPGRLQILHSPWTRSITQTDLSALENATVLIDGAHNAQSATVLRNYVNKIITQREGKSVQHRLVWILAMSQGKDVEKILRILIHPGDDLVLCEFGPVDGMPWVRSQPASVLETVAKRLDSKIANPQICSNILQALTAVVPRVQEAFKCGIEPIVVVAGSLYLVSDLLRLMREGHYSDEHC